MTGVHSSSSPTSVRISRVLPWPRSPSSTMSWPASSGALDLGEHRLVEADDPGEAHLARRRRPDQVVAQLGLDGLVGVARRAQPAERRGGRGGSRRHGGKLRLSVPATQRASAYGVGGLYGWHCTGGTGRNLIVTRAPVLAIDIGGTKLAAGLVDTEGQLLRAGPGAHAGRRSVGRAVAAGCRADGLRRPGGASPTACRASASGAAGRCAGPRPRCRR